MTIQPLLSVAVTVLLTVVLALMALRRFNESDAVEGFILLAFAVGLAGAWTPPALAIMLILFAAALYLAWRGRRWPERGTET